VAGYTPAVPKHEDLQAADDDAGGGGGGVGVGGMGGMGGGSGGGGGAAGKPLHLPPKVEGWRLADGPGGGWGGPWVGVGGGPAALANPSVPPAFNPAIHPAYAAPPPPAHGGGGGGGFNPAIHPAYAAPPPPAHGEDEAHIPSAPTYVHTEDITEPPPPRDDLAPGGGKVFPSPPGGAEILPGLRLLHDAVLEGGLGGGGGVPALPEFGVISPPGDRIGTLFT
jgi:hypothetical protein